MPLSGFRIRPPKATRPPDPAFPVSRKALRGACLRLPKERARTPGLHPPHAFRAPQAPGPPARALTAKVGSCPGRLGPPKRQAARPAFCGSLCGPKPSGFRRSRAHNQGFHVWLDPAEDETPERCPCLAFGSSSRGVGCRLRQRRRSGRSSAISGAGQAPSTSLLGDDEACRELRDVLVELLKGLSPESDESMPLVEGRCGLAPQDTISGACEESLFSAPVRIVGGNEGGHALRAPAGFRHVHIKNNEDPTLRPRFFPDAFEIRPGRQAYDIPGRHVL